MAEQRRGYLAAVYAVLQPRWDRVRARGDMTAAYKILSGPPRREALLSAVAKWDGPVGPPPWRASPASVRRAFCRTRATSPGLWPGSYDPEWWPAMWGFGGPAVPYLEGLLTHKDEPMREAAARSLERIKGAAARKALTTYRKVHPTPGAATRAAPSKLARLIRKIIELEQAKPVR